MRRTIILLLVSLVSVLGDRKGTTNTIFVKVLSETSVVIAVNGGYNGQYDSVKIKYRDSKDTMTGNHNWISKTFSKDAGGCKITNLSPSIFYFFQIYYIDGTTEYKSFPVYVMTKDALPAHALGVYDMLVQAPGGKKWSSYYSFWDNKLYSHNEDELMTSFNPHEAMSPFARDTLYSGFLIVMQDEAKTYLKSLFLNQSSFFNDGKTSLFNQLFTDRPRRKILPNKEEFFGALGPAGEALPENINDYTVLNIGFSAEHSEYYVSEVVRIGIGGYMHDPYEHIRFGIGFIVKPYTGMVYHRRNGDILKQFSMNGFILGIRDKSFKTNNGITIHCTNTDICGITGTERHEFNCEISNSWKQSFCPDKQTQIPCIKFECISNFSKPVNLQLDKKFELSLKIKWNEIDKSKLVQPGWFKYNVSIKETNGAWSADYHSLSNNINIINLNTFTNYTIKVSSESVSPYKVVATEFTDPIYITTKQGVPFGKASFTYKEGFNSSCILLKWNHIPENEVKGILQSYKLIYKKKYASTNYEELDTGLVKEYLVCGLEHYTDYRFKLYAKNADETGSQSADADVKSGEGVPSKPVAKKSSKDTGSYKIEVEWEKLNEQFWTGIPYIYRIFYRMVGEETFKVVNISESKLKVELTDLESYTEYEIAIAAATVIGDGPKSRIFIQRSGIAAPVGPPNSLGGHFIDSKSIKVSWLVVNELERKGPIKGYEVFCYSEDNSTLIESKDVRETESTIDFKDLDIYTVYNFKVLAYTIVGDGPKSNATSIRTDAEEPAEFPSNVWGYNTSATSIMIFWVDIPEKAWGGLITGFSVKYKSERNPDEQNTTEILYPNTSYEATRLTWYTNYTIQVACYNVKDLGPYSPPITIITEEYHTPTPPRNIKLLAFKFNEIEIDWESLEKDDIPGITRSFNISWIPVYAPEDLQVGVEFPSRRSERSIEDNAYTTGLELGLRSITVNPELRSFNQSGFMGNTVYNITISIDTKFSGTANQPVQVFTPEGSPVLSSVDISCETSSWRSIIVRWKHAPPAYIQGIRTKYMIYYQAEGGDVMSVEHKPYKQDLDLLFLTSYTNYTIWMSAFTKVGEGNRTHSITCKTFQTRPSAPPTNVIASSYESPYSSYISWKQIPFINWEGVPVGYTIFYEKVSIGEKTVFNPVLNEYNVSVVDGAYISNLDVYTQYKVRVAARTKIGFGRLSEYVIFDTCRVPEPTLSIKYVNLPPYVTMAKEGLKPNGIIVAITEQALISCAKQCKSFAENVSLTYKEVYVDGFSNSSKINFNTSQILIPRIDTGKVTLATTVYSITTPGFVLLSIPDKITEAAAKQEIVLINAIKEVLPLCFLYFLLNWLFGGLFWFCEPTEVEYKGTGISLAGLFEGLYLAVMTSTTVGYGDKVPISGRGRLYIVFWTLLGLVLTGIVTGSLSSALTVTQMLSLKETVVSEKVAAVYGTEAYVVGGKKYKKFDKSILYRTPGSILKAIRLKQIKFGLLDQYVATNLKHEIANDDLHIKTINYPMLFGMALFDEYKKLEVCSKEYIKLNSEVVSNSILENDEVVKRNETGEDVVHTEHKEEEVSTLISWEAPMYRKVFVILVIMWIVFNILGFIYEILRRKRNIKLRNKVYSQTVKLQQKQTEWKEFGVETKEDIADMTNRLKQNGYTLLYKHGQQLIQLRNEMSKLYAVNFKYVTESDLGVSLEEILKYKEEILNQPKVPFWQKLKTNLRRKRVWLEVKWDAFNKLIF